MKNNKEHKKHGMASHGGANLYLSSFYKVTFLLIPLLLGTKVGVQLTGIEFFANDIVKLLVSTIIFYFALPFFSHAKMEIKRKEYGMMTLVSIALGAGFAFSVIAAMLPGLNTEFYLEISTLIWVLLFGHYLEAKSSGAAKDALSQVEKLLPSYVHIIIDGYEKDVEISKLKVGDIVRVKPGEKIPADALVLEGSAFVDESVISGESKPVFKETGASVLAGSTVSDSAMILKITKVGSDSTVGQIKQLILQSRETKPKSQKIADTASKYLTFIAVAVSIISIFVWLVVIGQSLAFAVTLGITVLVIACPHALGLAIPAVSSIGSKKAIENGVFIRDMSKVEIVHKANVIIFDKTGTLTDGEFKVSEIKSLTDKINKEDILKLAYGLEISSSHIIASSIKKEAKKYKIKEAEFTNFKNYAGKGVSGKFKDRKYFLGNFRLMDEIGVDVSKYENINLDSTIIFLAEENSLLGYIKLEDTIKEDALKTINKLKEYGLKVVLLSGDGISVVKRVAKQLGINEFYGDVLPDDKYKFVMQYQQEGNIVIMVGDGINDAPALNQADIGIAVASGTDLALESGDMILIKDNPYDIYKIVKLSHAMYKKMVQNLWWALGYNIFAIPLAAGIAYPFGFILRPELGALLMSLSSVVVVINALTLKKLSFR